MTEADADHEQAHHHGDRADEMGVAVATVSTTRSVEDDHSGDAIIAIVEAAGFDVVTREVIPDDYDAIQRSVDALTRREDVDVIITNGGTGVTPDDVTVEAAGALFEKRLPGFGELFRRLSFEDIGTRTVGSRATAGIADSVVVFCLPGSPDAVRLGTESIIVEVAPHLVALAAPDRVVDHDHGDEHDHHGSHEPDDTEA